MFFNFLHEYYEFFIIIAGILILMLIGYIIFFSPKKTHNKKERKKSHKKIDSDEDIILNDDFTESELDEEFLAEETKEEFVLGENSNILESLPDKEETNFQKNDPVTIDSDHNATDAIFNDFKTLDQMILDEDNKSSKSENLENKLQKAVNIDDHEKVLTEIVNSVIQKNEAEEEIINGKYHVLYRKEDKKWYVKREGAKEGEKFLLTQKEAIAYATIQALIYDTNIVVHDEDGKIGKYKL